MCTSSDIATGLAGTDTEIMVNGGAAEITIDLPSLTCFVFNPVIEILQNYAGSATHINAEAIVD